MIDKKNIKNIYALSPMQQGMLLHSVYDDTLAYFEQVRYHIKGRLNVQAFCDSWSSIVKRHDIFRTVFVHEKVPQPIQIVFKTSQFKVNKQNIMHLDENQQQAHLSKAIKQDKETPFNLSKDILMRIELFTLGEDSFEVIWSFHHILMDGWSLGLIQTEFFQTYEALSKAQIPVLNAPIPYAQYIKYLKTLDHQQSKDFWREYLQGVNNQSSLPSSFIPEKIRPGYCAAEYDFELSLADSKAITLLAQQHQVTVGVLFQCLWAVYLNAFNIHQPGKLDVVYGVTVSGRPVQIRNVGNIIGLFINTVPQRFKASLKMGFADFVKASQHSLAESKMHHHTSLSEIQASSELKQHLFDHVFVFENYPFEDSSDQQMDTIGIAIEKFEHFDFTHYDFTFQMVPGEQFGFKFLYNTNLYHKDFFSWLESSILHSVKAIMVDPQVPLNSLLLPQHPCLQSDTVDWVLNEYKQVCPLGVPGDLYQQDLKATGKKAIRYADAVKVYDSLQAYQNERQVRGLCKISHQQILISASFTADLLSTSLDWWLDTFALPYKSQFSPYNQIFSQLADGDSELNQNTGMAIILLRIIDWLRDSPDASLAEQQTLIKNNVDYLVSLLQHYEGKARLFIGFMPYDMSECSSDVMQMLAQHTIKLSEKINTLPNLSLLDVSNPFVDYGLLDAFDSEQNRIGHIPYSENAFNCIGASTARALCAYLLPAFKVLVVDCDNTLWQGVVGEDGPLGVHITQAYQSFQQKLLDKYNSGFLLAIASKNNAADVWQVFDTHPDMLLKKHHFCASKIHWEPKSGSIQALAQELNLGLNSFIFFDDSQMECAEVMSACPEVLTVQFPAQGENIANLWRHLWALDQFRVTDEDRNRNNMLKAQVQRKQSGQQASQTQAFIKNLDLKIEVAVLDTQSPKSAWERASQLSYRTNQFNLNTQRRSEKELMALQQGNHELWLVRAADRFGQYGWVGLVIFDMKMDHLHLDTFILSCRVLARKIEHALFAALKQKAQGAGVKTLCCEFVASDRNQPIKRFIDSFDWHSQNTLLEMLIDNIAPMDSSLTFEQLQQFPVVKTQIDKPEQVMFNLDNQQSTQGINKQTAIQFTLSNKAALSHMPYYTALFASNADTLLTLPYQQISHRTVDKEYVAPETEREQVQVQIWQDLLKISQVGVLDNFFQMGGHSLLATRLLSGVYKDHQIKISLKDFFEHASVREFCLLIEQQQPEYDVIKKLPVQAHYELSYAQRRLWAVQQMDPHSFAYNTPNNYDIQGVLSVENMRQAFYAVFEKHESLRTCFDLVDGQPRQFIVDNISKTFEFSLLESIETDDIKNYLSKLGEQIFDLVKGPLIKVLLIKLDSESHILHVNMHHIISDGWSMELLEDEVLTVYEKLQQGQTSFKPQPLVLQYKDYAAWHNAKAKNNALRDYWLNKLSGELPYLSYPLDKKRPLVQTHVGRVKHFEFSAAFSAGLTQLGSQLQLSHFAIFNALVKLYLYKITGEPDLIVGAPVVGRSHPDCQQQIGFFVNSIVLRDQLNPKMSCIDWFKQVQTTLVDAYDHQDYPLNLLVKELGLDRDLSRASLFEIFLSYQKVTPQQSKQSAVRGVKIINYAIDAQISRFDLMFHLKQSDLLTLDITFNTDLYVESSINWAFAALQRIGECVFSNPNQALHTLSLLSDKDKVGVLNLGNHYHFAEQSSYEQHIFEVFDQVVKVTPDNTAIRFGEVQLSYIQLFDAVEHMSMQLFSSEQIGKGDIVAVYLPKSANNVILILALFKLGAVYLPIDITYPVKRVIYILQDSQAKLCITNAAVELHSRCITLAQLQSSRCKPVANEHAGTDSAYLIYTSGSTGQPKGVMLAHHGFVNMCMAQIKAFSIDSDDRVMWFSSPAFDASLSEIFMALLKGACLCIVQDDDIQDLLSFDTFIKTHEVNVLTLPPVYLHQLSVDTLAGIKTLITAGESPIKQDVQKLYQRLNYFNAYGPTESSVCATINRVSSFNNQQPLSIGKPINGLAVYLLDQDQQLVPQGVQGEIALSGIGLAQGYWQQSALTAEKFVKVVALDEQRVYLTGDLGYWDKNGELVFVSRKDNQVKLRGHRIELNEINNRLIDLGVTSEAHTLLVANQGNNKLVSFILADACADTDIKQALASYLPSYMIPHQIFALKHFTMTTNGKVDTHYLTEFALDNSRQQQFVAPKGELETLLLDLFKTTFGLDKISAEVSFFDLGGDSIKVIELVAKLRNLGYSLSSKDVFLYPQPITLAACLSKRIKNTEQLSLQDCTGEVLLSPIQAWFFDTLKQHNHHFNHSEVFFSESRLDIQSLKIAMCHLIDSFDLLKAKVVNLDKTPRLFIEQNDIALPLRIRNLTEQQVDAALMQDQSSFNLKQGPLWQFVVYATPQGDRLLMCFHHLIIDGISWRLVVQRFNHAYQQALQGNSLTASKTGSFKLFTKALHQYSQSEDLLAETDFWAQWADEKYIRLKCDKHVPVQQVDHVDAVGIKLSLNETSLLLKETLPQLKANINEYLLTCLAQSLADYRQQDQTLIMMEGHGRDEALAHGQDLSQVMGWFTNAYPLLISAKGNTLHECIAQNRQALANTPRAGIGFNILRYISPLYCEDLKLTDYKPQISFNYLGHYQEDLLLDFMTVDKTAPDYSISLKSEILYALNINGFIRNGQLEFYFKYHTRDFEQSTVNQIANYFLQQLKKNLPIVAV